MNDSKRNFVFKLRKIFNEYRTGSFIANLALILAIIDANLCCCMYIFHQPEVPKMLSELKLEKEDGR